MILHCPTCDRTHGRSLTLYTCPDCSVPLEVTYSDAEYRRARTFKGEGVWRYRALLPAKQAVTLGEGSTGLHPCPRLGRETGIAKLYVKNEGENPTGSFKDRGMTVGIAMAKAARARAVACASTGNTAASMAAYAARAGLRPLVLLPAGKVAAGKLSQAVAYGARIAQIDGNFDDAMRVVVELSERERGVYLLNSLNPYRLEGQKTLAFEICETLGRAPDAVVLPVGNAGNISAIWKGFREFKRLGRIRKLPRMIGVQAEGAAPVVRALRENADGCVVKRPETVATAIRIGAPVNWRKAIAAIRESGGEAGTVTDREILDAQKHLAETEGLFIEPASAAPIAYLRKHRLKGVRTVACVATGHGLKDPDVMTAGGLKTRKIRPVAGEIRKLLS